MSKWLGRHGWLAVLAVSLSMLLVFAACGDDEKKPGDTATPAETTAAPGKTVTVAAGEKIQVGITAVLAGDIGHLGEAVLKAAELAAQQHGAIEGFEVEIVSADDTCAAAGAIPAAQQLLANKNLVAVIGSICSGVNIAVQPTYEEAGITQVSSGSTAVVITYPKDREPFDHFLRTIVYDGVQGAKQADYAKTVLKATTAYIAHDTDTYGSGLADVFEEKFKEGGGEVVGRQGWEKKQTDFAALVTSVTTANPDLVYVAAFDPESAAFVTQLRLAGYEGDFMGGDGVITEQFLTLAKENAEGAHLSKGAPTVETAALTKFQTDFEAHAGFAWDRDPYTAETYDAYTAIFNGIKEVAKVVDGNLEIDLAAMNDAIQAQDFEGVTGRIQFDDHGDLVAQPGKQLIAFFKVVNGAYVAQEFE